MINIYVINFVGIKYLKNCYLHRKKFELEIFSKILSGVFDYFVYKVFMTMNMHLKGNNGQKIFLEIFILIFN